MVGLGININAEGEGKMVIYTEHPIGDRSPSKIFHKSASIMSVCYKGSGGVVFSSKHVQSSTRCSLCCVYISFFPADLH